MLGHLVLGGIEIALVWVSSGANPGDYPSRFRPLPPRTAIPEAFRHFFSEDAYIFQRLSGWELLAGSCVLTAAFRDRRGKDAAAV